jgi:DMSO/TMAO reductase YedYZ molybdopterin-dependent catalytic subunit
MNGEPLPGAHGAPLRLRVERQLGYKMAKYVMQIEAVASFADIGAARAATGRTAATSGTPVFSRRRTMSFRFC